MGHELLLSRRALVAGAAGAITLLVACRGGGRGRELTPVLGRSDEQGGGHRRGRLEARPRRHDTTPAAPPGVQTLDLGAGRTALLFVPSAYPARRPTPLAVALHGAGGDARGGLAPLTALAEELGVLLLAPKSARSTWDVLGGGYGPDVELMDRALGHTFDRYAVDPARVMAAGFSDGASYALSLGITNGDLFTSVLAFSPGFVAPGPPQGRPRLFVSHGTADAVLPVDATSRKLVPRFRRSGYDVRYVEFEGGHTVPREIARTAVGWALGLTI